MNGIIVLRKGLHLFADLRIPDTRMSVTRLGDFLKFLVINFNTKLAQM